MVKILLHEFRNSATRNDLDAIPVGIPSFHFSIISFNLWIKDILSISMTGYIDLDLPVAAGASKPERKINIHQLPAVYL